MTKLRDDEIEAAAKHEDSDGYFGFISGAKWADENPNYNEETFKTSRDWFTEYQKLEKERDCYREAFQNFYYEVKSWSDTYMEVNPTCTQTSLTIALPKAQEALAKYARENEGKK